MKLSDLHESGIIENLRRGFASCSPDVLQGIGDDCAVIRQGRQNLLITADMMIEGVHFDLSYTTFYQLGHKFLAVNVSDVLAMGGRPEHFTVSLGIPKTLTSENIDDLYKGMSWTGRSFGVDITGGDTCLSLSGLVLSGTLTGSAKTPILRSGARPGHGIFLTSTIGDSAMGLYFLGKGKKRVHRFSPSTDRLRLIKKHLMPVPAALETTTKISAMTDVSDGLLTDLSHICDESHTGAVIHLDRIPVSRALRACCAREGVDAIEYALRGGEDYCLLFTSPAKVFPGAYRIGEITRQGRFMTDKEGRKVPFHAEGFDHFKV